MDRRHAILQVLLATVLILAAGGCGDDSHRDAASGAHSGAGHSHQPKYGGRLVELGHHEGNVELVLDSKAGRLTLYVLDAHAENFVRLPHSSITLLADAPGGTHALALKPVANAATGETPGDTSQFEIVDEWLKSAPSFSGKIPELTVRSKTYRDVPFQLSK
jgi:hypothetical protein